MSSVPVPDPPQPDRRSKQNLSPSEQLRFAREVIRTEGKHLVTLAQRLDSQILSAAEMLLECSGSVVVTGIGKAGIIGQKLSATLASTGTRSHFLHSAEAVHGDLGRVGHDDVVVVLSQSGKTDEVVRLLPAFSTQAAGTIAITSSRTNPLGRAVDTVLEVGNSDEACSLGLAPSTSTTAMLAMCDALALLVSRLRGFGPSDFARYHPGGNLGLKLSTVDEVMRPVEQCRIASDRSSVRDVLVASAMGARRTGAVMLTGETGQLTGVFTDSDLAKLLERRSEESLDRAILNVMSREVSSVATGCSLPSAIQIFVERKISELPVVDSDRRPIGLIDITDVVGLLPTAAESDDSPDIIPFPAG